MQTASFRIELAVLVQFERKKEFGLRTGQRVQLFVSFLGGLLGSFHDLLIGLHSLLGNIG
ncbi:hypothetical protein D1872_302700 [compost metagenome]